MTKLSISNACIVDDDPFWTGMLSQILLEIGVKNITNFDSGNDFLKDTNKAELIFLDYQMDNMDGLEVLALLRKTNPSIKVVFCTSVEDLSVAMKALNLGSVDFLLKSNINAKEVSTILGELYSS